MKSKNNRLKKKLDKLMEKTVRDALKRHKWRLTPAANHLGMPMQTLQSIIKRNPKLNAAYLKNGHGRGRPLRKHKTA